MVDFYGFHVGKYTSPMDVMGCIFPQATKSASVMSAYRNVLKVALLTRPECSDPVDPFNQDLSSEWIPKPIRHLSKIQIPQVSSHLPCKHKMNIFPIQITIQIFE